MEAGHHVGDGEIFFRLDLFRWRDPRKTESRTDFKIFQGNLIVLEGWKELGLLVMNPALIGEVTG